MSPRLRVPELSLNHSRHKSPLLLATYARLYFTYLDCFVWDYFLVLNNLQNVSLRTENRRLPLFGNGFVICSQCPYLGQFGSNPVSKASFITTF